MRVLQINAVYKRLSTGINVYELNKALQKQGHRCTAVYSVGQVSDPEEEYLIGSLWGQKLHALLSRLTGLQGYYSSWATRKLLKYMKADRPDAVVLNNLHANYIHLPMLLKYLGEQDIPTLAVLHDCWFYTGKCCYYTAAGCDRWKTGCGNCPILDQHNKSWFFDRTRKMHRDRVQLFRGIPRLGVVAVSDWLLQQAKESPVFEKAELMTRIYNWIDMETFCPVDASALREKLGLINKKVYLSVAAVWEDRKGVSTLIKIAEQLREDEQLIIVGKLEKDTVLPRNVLLIPRTDSREELVQYYSMADVFLQPSMEETFGKVTAEALSCGTPVVCFNSTANPELIGPGCGAVVQSPEAEAMLQQARQIAFRGKEAYSAGCRTFALERFEKEMLLDQYLQTLIQLQGKNPEQI